MYRYVFTKEQRYTIQTQKWLGELVEFAPVPPPLSEAEEQLAEQPVRRDSSMPAHLTRPGRQLVAALFSLCVAYLWLWRPAR